MKALARVFLLLIAAFTAGSFGVAAGASIKLTVTNQNLVLVQETRTLQVAVGEGVEMVLEDIAQSVDPRSVQVMSVTAPDQFRVRTMVFRHDLISAGGLLDRFVGRQVKVVIPDPNGAEGARLTRDATLLATSDRPVFAIDGQVYVGAYEALWLPNIPQGMRSTPAFVWVVDNSREGPQDITVTYLAGSIGWDATYTLTLDEAAGPALLEGRMVVHNESGKAYRAAALNLMAGKLRVTEPPVPPGRRLRAAAEPTVSAQAAPFEAIAEQPAFEYHLYQLGSFDIPDREDLQIAFLHAKIKSVNRELISRGRVLPNYRANPDGSETIQEVLVRLKFNNSLANNLGQPLPGGDLRAYQRLADERMIPVGQDRIKPTPVDSGVELTLGTAFDLKVQRKLLGLEKVDQTVIRSQWELSATNSKDQAQELLLEEELPGAWKILNSSEPYEQLDAGTVRFKLKIPAKGNGSVRYLVEINRI